MLIQSLETVSDVHISSITCWTVYKAKYKALEGLYQGVWDFRFSYGQSNLLIKEFTARLKRNY